MIVDRVPGSLVSVAIDPAMRTTAAAGVGQAGGVDFGTILGQLSANATGTLQNAEATAIAGIQGHATAQQVVDAVMNAEQTLQGAIAIRDKVVSAYLELSRMSI